MFLPSGPQYFKECCIVTDNTLAAYGALLAIYGSNFNRIYCFKPPITVCGLIPVILQLT